VAAETSEVLRHTVKGDTLVLLPVVPCGPLRLDAGPKQRDFFSTLCRLFTAIPSLGGCPLVTLPVEALPDGTPLAVGFFGVARSDMRLLAVAAKMVPLIREAAAREREEAAAAASGAPAASGAASASGAAAASAPAGAPPAVDARAAERAERHKDAGNAAFKAGKFTEAVSAYTKAIQANGDCHVYFNNRAMACLKARAWPPPPEPAAPPRARRAGRAASLLCSCLLLLPLLHPTTAPETLSTPSHKPPTPPQSGAQVFRFEQAEDDAQRVLTGFPALPEGDRVKALLRRGTARMGLHKFEARCRRRRRCGGGRRGEGSCAAGWASAHPSAKHPFTVPLPRNHFPPPQTRRRRPRTSTRCWLCSPTTGRRGRSSRCALCVRPPRTRLRVRAPLPCCAHALSLSRAPRRPTALPLPPSSPPTFEF